MCKKKTLIIGLQVLVIAVFVGMALACKTNANLAPQAPSMERESRGACGNPDYVFMGQQPDLSACSRACQAKGLGSPCYANGNCFCK